MAGVGWPPNRAEVAALFDARAGNYDDSTMHRWLAEKVVSLATVGEDALVVDVAAGTGLAGRALRRRRPSARVVAVDLAAELLRVAATHHLLAVQADAERLPIGSHTADAVLCVSAAAYFPHPQLALGEFARVLRPGGTCLIQTWSKDTIAATRVLRRVAATAGVVIPDPNSALGTTDRLRNAMESAGLTGVTVDDAVWHATWPVPDDAWRSVIQGPFSGLLQSADRSVLSRVRDAFVSELHALIGQHADDAQEVLIGIGKARD